MSSITPPTPIDAQRPAMRRKSSAQNLLSSFKPPPVQTLPGPASSVTSGLSYVSSVSTPTASTPMLPGREWDSQSMHSDPASAVASNSPALNQGTSVEFIRDLVQKRIISLTYIRNIHQGHSHWFHTILVSRQDLDRVFNNQAMKKRTYRFAILGMSLSNLLDIQNPQDLLRGLIATMAEYEQTREDSDKPKMRLFKQKNKRPAGGFAEYAAAAYDANDTSYLSIPHLPFPLDYHETLLSLLDVISETYHKISRFLGPSPFPRDMSQQYMTGPLGMLTPHPGVSYLFANSTNAPYMNAEMKAEREDPSSLWSIANGVGGGFGGGTIGFHGSVSPPASNWTGAMGEMVLKVDGKFKKITSNLLKELDTFARNGIKDELASLDPLKSLGGAIGGHEEVYDFEGM